MAPARMPRERAQQVVGAVNNAIKAGYTLGGIPSAIEIAAKALGWTGYTVRDRLKAAKRWYGLEPDEPEPEGYRIPEIAPLAKPRVIVRAASAARPEGEPIRVMFIGDTHCGPGVSNERFKWFARHVAATRPDRVVQVGDLGDFASMSAHERPGSLQQKAKPKFQDDLASIEEALAIYRHELGDSGIPHHVTLGNHEDRVQRFQDATSELEGALWPQFTDILARYDWRWTEYRQYLFIASCGVTHVPQTVLEKPYGGKTLNPLSNDLVYSLIFGHSHNFAFLSVGKIGPQQTIEILNVGSAMPHGHFPHYNVSEQGGITWGIVDATLHGGHIVRHHFIPMTHLEEMYG